MADLPNNVRFTWQLVSQFVSWEFCRYMSENNENNNPDTDVLSFLRNMIVQRTEKSVSDVTKQEILAKFIMEIKAIDNFQASNIIPLSESVKRICPELDSAVNKLIHHLESFFDILETTDEDRKEIIQLRIEDSISDFSKEASRLLPEPELLRVVDSWNDIHHHHHNHPHPEPPKKCIYSLELFEKVLECLHFESITPAEARIIAVALNEDKVFENIFQNAQASETSADSDALTFSESSQPVYSQEFLKNTRASKTANPLHHQSPPNFQVHSEVPLAVDASPLHLSSDGSPVLPNNFDPLQNDDQPDVIAGSPPSPPPSPPQDYPFFHRDVPVQSGNPQLQKSASDIQFAQSSANESDEDDGDLHDRIQSRLQQIHEAENRQSQCDVDTSDCDMNEDIRFLTPTYFKKGKNMPIYISDVESNDSSINTNPAGSQQTDPSWSKWKSTLPATQYVRPNKRKQNKKNVPAKKKKKNSPVKKKKPAPRMPSSDTDENAASPASRKSPLDLPACTVDVLRSPHLISVSRDCTIDEHRSPRLLPVSPDCPIDDLSPHLSTSATRSRAALGSPRQPSTSATRSRAPFGSPHQPSTSATHTRAEVHLKKSTKGPLKRGQMPKSLYRSPTLCIDDFISTIRKPNSDTLSEVSVPNVTTAKKGKKTAPSGFPTQKKLKCKQCNKPYKTAIALRRHVFLKHTDPPEDSDCDS